jgi:hypothetical protein
MLGYWSPVVRSGRCSPLRSEEKNGLRFDGTASETILKPRSRLILLGRFVPCVLVEDSSRQPFTHGWSLSCITGEFGVLCP